MDAITSAARIIVLVATPLMFAASTFAQSNTYEGPVGVTGIFNGNVTTGCSYDPLSQSAHRTIDDIIVPGAIGKYPLKMTRYYNSRQQYYAGIGLSPAWAHEYSWLWGSGNKVISPHGNVYDAMCGEPRGVSEYWENGYTWRLADGGRVHFSTSTGRCDYIEDPYGLRTNIDYINNQLWRVTEPGGRCLIFTAGPAHDRDGTVLLTKVEAYDYYNGHRIDWVSYSYAECDPIIPSIQSRRKMMLTGVTYSDGTSAVYSYTSDNVPENSTSHKMYPLLLTANDSRYSGAMRQIAYDYSNGSPHGVVYKEKHGGSGSLVSQIQSPVPLLTADGPMPNEFTETRGDGPTRKFHYTEFSQHHRCEGCGTCDDYEFNDHWPDRGPQQMLQWYTDFQNHKTWLDYDSNWYVRAVTDARGSGPGDPSYTTTYARGSPPPDGIGQIQQITHPDGYSIYYDYEDPTPQTGDPHYVTRITDERGNVTKHFRDAKHRIYRTEYRNPGPNDSGALLAYETFSYCDQGDPQCSNNPLGQIKTHRLKNGAFVHYHYDWRGLLIDKWEPTWNATALDTDPKTHYDYYTTENYYTATDNQLVYPWTDRVKKVTLPANANGLQASDTYEYDRVLASGITNLSGAARPGRGLVTKITHADGKYQQFKNDAYANKRWEDNELRKATSYAYDDYNRMLSVTRPLNNITTYTYNPVSGSSYTHTTNSPDTITVRTGSTTNIVTRNVYDPNFRRISSTAADGTLSTATTRFHYDTVGNQDYVTDPRGSDSPGNYTTYSDFDSRNRKWRVREPLGRTTEFHYDDGINITTTIRGVGTSEQATETKVYDGMNRLTTDIVPKEQGVNIVTQLQYYPCDGNPIDGHSGSLLWKITDGENHTTTFEYDPSGLKTTMTYPDGSLQLWAYDDVQNLKNRTTANREVQNFEYDNRNRKITEWWDGWPADGEWRAFRYDDANHLTLATNGIGAYWQNFIADVRRAYDDAGRLTLDQQTVYVNGVANTKAVNYPSYDDSGKLLRMYVDGVSPAYDYTFGYDDMGRFQKIFVTGNNNAQFEYSYDPASNETQRSNWANHIAQNYVPDELNRLSSVEVKNTYTNAQLGLETYGYYPIGRLRSVTREDNRQDSFTYFLDGELNVATYGAAATPAPTPTAAPSATPTPIGGQVAEPTFAPAGGNIYPNTSVRVQISTTTSGAQIRYTLDGGNTSTTIANGGYTIYFQPGVAGKILTAVAFKSGMIESDSHSEEYLYDNGHTGAGTYPLDTVGPQPSPGPMAPNVSTVTYTLDKAGNRLSVNGMNYSPNNINQYTSVGGNGVANGNDHETQMYCGLAYYYMRDQELTRITGTGLIYDRAHDALGRCVRRTLTIGPKPATVTYYIYDGDKPILEYRSEGTIARNLYGKGIDEILTRTDPAANAGQPFYFQQDHEGSVTHLTNWNNGNGQIIERYRYDAFGAPTIYAPD